MAAFSPFLLIYDSHLPLKTQAREEARRQSSKCWGHWWRALIRKFNKTTEWIKCVCLFCQLGLSLRLVLLLPWLQTIMRSELHYPSPLRHHQAEGRLAPPGHLHVHLRSASSGCSRSAGPEMPWPRGHHCELIVSAGTSPRIQKEKLERAKDEGQDNKW